jgi:hypothetical protein
VICTADEYGVESIVDGAAPVVIRWPYPVILLLGALPGLIVLADTAKRRARRRPPGAADLGAGRNPVLQDGPFDLDQ